MTVSYDDILEAQKRVSSFIHRTPVLSSQFFNKLSGAEVYFKCENFQKTGSFKIRGATNAVFSLSENECSLGVATHSSGNHGAALAQAATWRKTQCHVVVPKNAPHTKIAAIKNYGARITLCEPSLRSREAVLQEVIAETGATYIPPYNANPVIAGQGTAVLELCQSVPNLDVILVPIGGGGLAAGSAISATHSRGNVRLIAVEPKGADDAARSFQGGELVVDAIPETIADGLRTSLGSITWPLVRDYVSDIVVVSEDSIIQATKTVWERMKIVVEPSGAVPVAALTEDELPFRDQKVGIVISGGNVDLDKLPWV